MHDRTRRACFLLSIIAVVAGITALPAAAQITLRASHAGAGQAEMTGGSFSLRSTAGQATARITGSDPYVGAGFWYAVRNTSVRLPVELTSFTARPDRDAVQLIWQTASETDNAGFYVQRRTGSGSFTDLGFVAGAETSTTSQSYRFTDRDLPFEAETITYRLRQVDVDGSETLTDPVVAERDAVGQLQLLGTFPNPARTHATVRFTVPEGAQRSSDVRLQIFDMLGRRVHEVVNGGTPGRQELELTVDHLASGTYFLRLTSGGQTRTQKMTIVR